MALPSSCPDHHELVRQALAPDASDELLERYAEEVPACDGCRRALARELQVHPVVLESTGRQADLHGMAELQAALEPPARARRALPMLLVGGAGLAIAAAAGWLIAAPRPAPPTTPVAARPAPVLVEEPQLGDAPVEEPAQAEPIAPRQVRAHPEPVRSPAPTQVAMATAYRADWPAPTFVELRQGTAKGTGGVRSAQLVLGGTAPPRHVGDIVQLTVVSSTHAEVAVCVHGPEQGIVWRGGIPAGRVPLTQGGRDVSFAFSAPGTYRFSVTTDLEDCTEPVHVVDVEVHG